MYKYNYKDLNIENFEEFLKNPNNINNTQGDETDVMINNSTEYTPIENPIRDYMKNDTIQLTPEWTPNASGNKIEDL